MSGVNVSVYAYDEAIVDNLREIFDSPKSKSIHIVPPSEMFDLEATLNRDDTLLPMISLTRTGWNLPNERRPFPLKTEGVHMESVMDSKENREQNIYKNLQALPIAINYQLDVWTESRLENDVIMRELIWYYSLNPTLTVMIPHDLNIQHTFNIFLGSDIEDNSDISEHKNRGRYFRQTIGMYTDDAYLWKVSKRHPHKIDLTALIIEEKNGEEIEYVSNKKHFHKHSDI